MRWKLLGAGWFFIFWIFLFLLLAGRQLQAGEGAVEQRNTGASRSDDGIGSAEKLNLVARPEAQDPQSFTTRP